MNIKAVLQGTLFFSCLFGNSIALQAQDDIAIRELVSRLDLKSYKSVIKGLTQFGDRRQGTSRNQKAVDWIEQQLQAVGCSNTKRLATPTTRNLALQDEDKARPNRLT